MHARAASGNESSASHAHGSVRLRPARASDVDTLEALEARAFGHASERFHRRQIRRLIRSPSAMAVVAVLNRRVVGWSVGLLRCHERSRSGRLYAIAVDPQAQGLGLGRRLAEHVLRTLARRGARRLYLEVQAQNQPALGLYRKLGFTHYAFLPDYYAPGRHGVRLRMTADPLASLLRRI